MLTEMNELNVFPTIDYKLPGLFHNTFKKHN